MALFAHKFRDHVFNSMSSQILGSREEVHLAYVHAFLAGAAAIIPAARGKVKMERPAGASRLDLIIQGTGEGRSVLLELKRVRHDKSEGYRASEAKRLTTETGKAMMQHDSRHYRASLPADVTELREYGLAFTGPYCAVEGRSLERQAGRQWIVKDLYSAEQDEKERAQFYTVSVRARARRATKKGRRR